MNNNEASMIVNVMFNPIIEKKWNFPKLLIMSLFAKYSQNKLLWKGALKAFWIWFWFIFPWQQRRPYPLPLANMAAIFAYGEGIYKTFSFNPTPTPNHWPSDTKMKHVCYFAPFFGCHCEVCFSSADIILRNTNFLEMLMLWNAHIWEEIKFVWICADKE